MTHVIAAAAPGCVSHRVVGLLRRDHHITANGVIDAAVENVRAAVRATSRVLLIRRWRFVVCGVVGRRSACACGVYV